MEADGSIGMLDLWAASKLLSVKGDEIYVMGQHMMREQLAEQEKRDPTKRILKAVSIPEARA